MIKIEPYYRREPDGEAILKNYLRMVADVVPFEAEDVLFGDPEGIALAKAKRQHRDGELAEWLIRGYSKGLHAFLYKDGHVDHDNLHDLLTVTMPRGELPKELIFKDANEERALQLLKNVFRYDALSRHAGMYPFVQSLGVEVCPYCNRQFTTTVDNGVRRSRPQLDHFKNKSDYPYLALSINNLVPCCGVCNLLKHDKDAEMVYPYEEEFGEDCVFTMQFRDEFTAVMTGAVVSPEHFDIKLKPSIKGNSAIEGKIKGSIKALALEEMYQAHNGYVAALAFQRYITTEAMIDDIFSQFGGDGKVFKTRDEVRMALTLMNTEPEHWGERPLAKLTHDIQRELEP